jgi:hypothetical protein
MLSFHIGSEPDLYRGLSHYLGVLISHLPELALNGQE